MICTYYQNDNLDILNEHEQQQHLQSCSLCRERKEFEDQIINEAGQMAPVIPGHEVWDRIEKSLRKENTHKKGVRLHRLTQPRIWLSAAAVIIALFSLPAYYLLSESNQKILSDGALLRVELTEQNYIAAIRELEQEAGLKMTGMDLDLMLLYRDKLETMERQIKRCQEAINNNPGNAHIRRYMLAALQDKKETLKEILDI